MHRTGLLPDVDRARRKRIVRAVHEGSATESLEDAELALEAINWIREHELRRPVVRWLPWIAGPMLVTLFVIELAGEWSLWDVVGLSLVTVFFASLWWWYRRIVPERLNEAEANNLALLSEEGSEDARQGDG